MDHLSAILDRYTPISLDEMNEVRLLNRSDTKFVFNIDTLADVLDDAAEFYKLLTINNLNILNYHTQYFDSPDLKCYYDHHNGARSRFKVRFREYSDTGQVFLEVKEKNNKERTIKNRILVERMENSLSDQAVSFIEQYTRVDGCCLIPAMLTKFSRITLVNEQDKQRITIDLNISFENKRGVKKIPYLVICEVKLDRNIGRNIFSDILKSQRIYPLNMSKYSIGTALLEPDIKQNRFKEKIIALNKLRNDTGSYNAAS